MAIFVEIECLLVERRGQKRFDLLQHGDVLSSTLLYTCPSLQHLNTLLHVIVTYIL